MEFIKELEDKAYLLDFDNKPYKRSEAVKDAAVFGMSDTKLKEKALSDDPDLTLLLNGAKLENRVNKVYILFESHHPTYTA